MHNLISSEHYHLIRKRSLYIVTLISMIFIFLAAMLLTYYGHSEASFRYYRIDFFFMSALSINLITILVIYFFGTFILTATDYEMMSYQINIGISRTQIFWGKFIISLLYFFVFCLMVFIEMMVLSALFFPDFDQQWWLTVKAVFNTIPLFFSIFCVTYGLSIIRVHYLVSIIILTVLYIFSEKITYVIAKKIEFFETIRQYTPNQLNIETMNAYYSQNLTLQLPNWLVGLTISIVFLSIAYIKFRQKEV